MTNEKLTIEQEITHLENRLKTSKEAPWCQKTSWDEGFEAAVSDALRIIKRLQEVIEIKRKALSHIVDGENYMGYEGSKARTLAAGALEKSKQLLEQ